MTSSRDQVRPAADAGAVGEAEGVDGAGRAPRYTLRPVVKPLPSQVSRPGTPAGATGGPRAETEDDDGYDPYSDYHDGTARAPEFEPDPWG